MDYTLANKAAEQAIIDDILGDDRPVNATLYQTYADNLQRAVGRVFAEDDGSGLSDRLRANVSRFAAYKAYHATQLARMAAAEPDGDPRKVLHAFNRYQAAEHNTTVTRCRTAKQWCEFADPDRLRLFPNLRWLPSRSATPREEHMRFYNRVWAKSDPFWQQNQPGNLWNCKCDWEETDDPTTDGNPTTPVRHNGLEGNPALTGQVFTDNHAYFAKAGENKKEERKNIENLCRIINKEATIRMAKDSLSNKTSKISLNGIEGEIIYTSKGIKHMANDMNTEKDSIYWLKNEIIPHIDRYITNAKLRGRKNSDASHNTNKETVKLKRNTDYFYYLETMLPNGQKCCLHIGHYKTGYHVSEKAGKFYIYSITTYTPKNIESI